MTDNIAPWIGGLATPCKADLRIRARFLRPSICLGEPRDLVAVVFEPFGF
jgi:hypothetical protein